MNNVLYLLERLPESMFSPAPPSPPSLTSHFSSTGQPGYPPTPGASGPLASESMDSLTSPATEYSGFPFPSTSSLPTNNSDETLVDDTARKTHIQHILDAERKYVADLEVMHEYARELVQRDVLNADTVHHLFPGLGKLLDFGRRFLIEMEGVAECPWEEQRWGLLFVQNVSCSCWLCGLVADAWFGGNRRKSLRCTSRIVRIIRMRRSLWLHRNRT